MGGQPDTVTQISKVELPDWVNNAAEGNYRFAQDIASRPYVPYSGQTVAPLGQGTADSWNYFYDTLDDSVADYGSARGVFNDIASGKFNATPMMIKAGQLKDVNIDDYLNPYLGEVEDNAMARMSERLGDSLRANSDRAIAAKAFGGSRGAIVDALSTAENAKDAGELSANIRKGGYDSAMGWAYQDIMSKLQADTSNQGADLQADIANMQGKLGAGQGLLSTGDAMNRARSTNFAGLNQIGLTQQAQTQRYLDDQKARWDEAKNFDTENLNLLLSSLGMSPYGKSETTTKTADSGGPDWVTGGLGLLSVLPALFGMSDRTMKTDVNKLGRKNEFGLDLYAYRYKGDPKSYPKVVGPMAQDIEKKFPGSTIRVGGKLAAPVGLLHG